VLSAGSRRWWALAAISLAILAITLDITVLMLALPTLAGALKASESELQWFVSAYTLALVAGMLPAGLIGDRYGQRTVMSASLVLFALASAGCAFAPNPALFIVARVLVAVAGAMIIVVALSAVTVLFAPEERPRAIGIWSAANFLGMPLGPILGGWILAHFFWGWIFLMNVPVALVALLAVLALVPARGERSRTRVDGLGLVAASLGLTALMYGIIEAGSRGWLSPHATVPAAGGLLVLVAFWALERRVGRTGGTPVVDFDVFRSPSFTWGVVLSALGSLGLFGVLFALPQFMQAIQGIGVQGTGLRLLPAIVGLIVGALPADRVAGRLGAKLTVAGGFAVAVAGSLWGATLTTGSSTLFLATWTFIVGAGAGLGFATAASVAVVELPAESSGVGSALLQAVIKLGPAIGSSVLGSVLSSAYQSRLALSGLPRAAAAAARSSVFAGLAVAHELGSQALLQSVRSAFTSGLASALVAAAAVFAGALILVLLFLPARRARAAGQAGAAQD